MTDPTEPTGPTDPIGSTEPADTGPTGRAEPNERADAGPTEPTGRTEPEKPDRPAEPTAATDPDEVVALEQLNGQLYAAIEAADLDRMGRVWLDHPHQQDPVCVHPGWPPIQGRDQILRSWAAIMANTSYIQFFLTDVEVSIAGDVAVVTCAENILTAVGDAETESSALAGGHVVATNVFRRTRQGWRLWVHHASPVLTAQDGEVEEE